jgi:hypothetical protein
VLDEFKSLSHKVYPTRQVFKVKDKKRFKEKISPKRATEIQNERKEDRPLTFKELSVYASTSSFSTRDKMI